MKHLILLFTLFFSLNAAAQSASNSSETVATEHAIIQDSHGDNVCSKDEKVLSKEAVQKPSKQRRRYKRRRLKRYRCIYYY